MGSFLGAFADGVLDAQWERPTRLAWQDVVGRGPAAIGIGLAWIVLVIVMPWAMVLTTPVADRAPLGLVVTFQLIAVVSLGLRLWRIQSAFQSILALVVLVAAVLYLLDGEVLVAGYLLTALAAQIVTAEIRLRQVAATDVNTDTPWR